MLADEDADDNDGEDDDDNGGNDSNNNGNDDGSGGKVEGKPSHSVEQSWVHHHSLELSNVGVRIIETYFDNTTQGRAFKVRVECALLFPTGVDGISL